MRPIKVILVVLLFLANLVVAPPSLADRIAKKSPDYPVVVQALDDLLQVENNPEQTEYTQAELQQKIADLRLQKYILETSEDWGQCRNETGKLLAVYAHKPKKISQNTLYYLADGEATDDDWDCEGVYLPSDAKVAGVKLVEGESTALKITDGTQLIATTNPETEEIEFNVPLGLIEILKPGEANWQIPTLAQADIDQQAPNAPVD